MDASRLKARRRHRRGVYTAHTGSPRSATSGVPALAHSSCSIKPAAGSWLITTQSGRKPFNRCFNSGLAFRSHHLLSPGYRSPEVARFASATRRPFQFSCRAEGPPVEGFLASSRACHDNTRRHLRSLSTSASIGSSSQWITSMGDCWCRSNPDDHVDLGFRVSTLTRKPAFRSPSTSLPVRKDCGDGLGGKS